LETGQTRALTLRLGTIVALALSSAVDTAAAQETGVVSGQVVDAESGRAVTGVLIVIGDAPATITNQGGYFAVADVPVGRQFVQLTHLGYGEHAQDVLVEPDVELSLTIRLSVQAIELEPLLVETGTELEQRRRTSGYGMNEIQREEIEAAASAGLGLTELLQTSMPGTLASVSGTARTCVMYRSIRRIGERGCQEVSVFIDGVLIANPSYIYQTMPLQDIERMEMLSPGQAGLRYGTASGQAVLLIETRQGEATRRVDASRFVTGFQWRGEEAPYDWAKVLASTFVVNAVVVASSLALAERCLWSPEIGSLGLRTRCNGFNTASIGLLSIAVPAVTGGMVARWGGRTDRTTGRLAPMALAGAMALTGGYLLVIQGGDSATKVGYGVLAAGVPLTLALADRIFRVLR
jgi:hypothetical protein